MQAVHVVHVFVGLDISCMLRSWVLLVDVLDEVEVLVVQLVEVGVLVLLVEVFGDIEVGDTVVQLVEVGVLVLLV